MASFQITVSPNRRAAARFVARVHRAISEAYVEQAQKDGKTQSEIARMLGVHRSVINRELRGASNLTLGRVAELAWAMGKKPTFKLEDDVDAVGTNNRLPAAPTFQTRTTASNRVTATSTSMDKKLVTA